MCSGVLAAFELNNWTIPKIYYIQCIQGNIHICSDLVNVSVIWGERFIIGFDDSGAIDHHQRLNFLFIIMLTTKFDKRGKRHTLLSHDDSVELKESLMFIMIGLITFNTEFVF